MKHILGFALLFTISAACVAEDDGDPSTPAPPSLPGGPDGGTSEATIDGLPASDYFGQFVWEQTDAPVGGAAAFPATGRYDAFRIDAFLLEDGDLHLFYAEGAGEVWTTGSSLSLDPATYTRLEGTWHIDGIEVVLGPWFRCGGVQVDVGGGNERPFLRCELQRSVVSEAALGATGFLSPGFPSSPFDSEWNDYE